MTKAAVRPGAGDPSVGSADQQKPHMIYTLGRTRGPATVTFHEQKAKELYDDYGFLIRSSPAKDVLFYESDIQQIFLPQSVPAVSAALSAVHAWHGHDITDVGLQSSAGNH